MSAIRTRFAPSPTGFLHVGGLRTALYNYLFAKKNKGTFILRIEDTDQARMVPGAVENLISTLEWAGIMYDEGPHKSGSYGPYIQSQRLEIYHKYVNELIAKGHAYYCFCSPERLENVRQRQIAAKLPPAYDRHCRNNDVQVSRERIAQGEKYVIRMKVPSTGACTFTDLIRQTVSIDYKNVDDQVLLKSDGFPTYHLAVVVDDHEMAISHVIRGEEWLSSTPKHLLLYDYFGWHPPLFAHLPLLLNPDKSKLSKRQGDVAVEDYRDKGFLKEALINFIAFLGWNPGDTREIFSLEELIQEFSLERVGKAGAVFNLEKLHWFNQQHLRLKTDDELVVAIKPLLLERGWHFSDDYIYKVIGLAKERMTFIKDLVEPYSYFYQDPTSFDQTFVTQHVTPQTKDFLKNLKTSYEKLPMLTVGTAEETFRKEASAISMSPGKLFPLLRLAISGQTTGPALFPMIEVLGKEAVIKRLNYALTHFTH